MDDEQAQVSVPLTMEGVPMPPRIARLPRNRQGYPIPWFVCTLPDRTRDFRIADKGLHRAAIRFRLCWVCGDQLGRYAAFVVGPMCAINRVSGEPPSHRDCAIYSARVCPFMANPQMRRRESGKPAGLIPAPGEPILRNPGVALVWVTRDYQAKRSKMGNDGYLFHFGDPNEALWYAEGRTATRAEVVASIQSGLPLLREACLRDDDPQQSLKDLDADYQAVLPLLPKETVIY